MLIYDQKEMLVYLYFKNRITIRPALKAVYESCPVFLHFG